MSLAKKLINDDISNVIKSIGQDELTEEELQELERMAKEEFAAVEGVEFDEINIDDEKNINNDFKITRDVLTRNINRLEKLTNLCINAVSTNSNNFIMLQTTLGVISENNKSLKLLSELQGKLFLNKQTLRTLRKLNEEESPKNESSKLGDGFTLR